MSQSNQRIDAAQKLKKSAVDLKNRPCLLGFDGFVDYIIRMVDKKITKDDITFIPTISSFAERLQRAAGKSSNIELRIQQVKLGGNGPIMANAMSQFGLPITYFGSLGASEIHPAFVDFSKRAQVYSLGEPAVTDALEFEDGKILMGKHEALHGINYQSITRSAGAENFDQLWQQSQFVGMVNWTMLDAMTEIWQELLAKNCPNLPEGERRVVFFDLADPEKRSKEDILEALHTLAEFAKYYTVILGVNEKESDQIAAVLDIGDGPNSPESLQKRAAAICKKLKIQTTVIHPVKYAVAANQYSTAYVDGPFVAQPLISTGAGDHFNAGFSLATLLELDLTSSLLTGVSTSGFYVRKAQSPTVPDLIEFLHDWK
ncbi:MAG: hypothetical protein DWQ05_06150 [Calditrichaeota bacterium]|nr:MAG: hypothetical protein DWQ05_06150 [Calditrichota bacterium]